MASSPKTGDLGGGLIRRCEAESYGHRQQKLNVTLKSLTYRVRVVFADQSVDFEIIGIELGTCVVPSDDLLSSYSTNQPLSSTTYFWMNDREMN